MLIGELSKRTGLSRDTIRFYEKSGLIALNRKERRDNNYKEYSEETLQQLMTIKLIKSFGFTLTEVSDILVLMGVSQANCDNVLNLFEDKIRKVDDKIRDLIDIRTLLLDGKHKCQSFCCNQTGSDDNCLLLVAQS